MGEEDGRDRETGSGRTRLFLRRPYPGLYSIERLFGALLPHLEAEARTLPEPSVGVRGRGRNLAFVRRERARGGANHISGDVNYVALALPRRGLVITVHDLATLERLRGVRLAVFRTLWFALPLRRAAVVTTVSEAVREDVERRFPFVRGRVRTVPNPLLPEFAAAPRPWPGSGEGPVRVLLIGRAWNKNLERQARALAEVARGGREIHVTLVGEPSEELRGTLAGLDHAVRSDLTDAETLAEYRGCDVLLFASLHEGFGMPIVEAQATGRPVITSDRGAMREVAGGAALLVDPEDEGAIRGAIETLLSDAELRERLVAAGLENARRYTVEAVAALYRDAYRHALR